MSERTVIRYTLKGKNSDVFILQVYKDGFELFDNEGNRIDIDISLEKRKLLNKLLEHKGEMVSYIDLYTAYSTDSYIDGSEPSKVQGMVYGLCTPLKNCISNSRGKGYSITVEAEEEVTIDTSIQSTSLTKDFNNATPVVPIKNPISDLSGSYYGFYLDRIGSGSMFGVYLHIDNWGTEYVPDMRVHAILGIQNNNILFGKEIAEVFSEKQHDYSVKFAQFREKLTDKDKECFIGTGTIIPHKAIIEITFGAITDEEWHIFVDLQGYLADTRTKEQDTDKYRGGLGLAFAFWSEFGDTCFRFAFVRTSLYSTALSLNNEFIRDKLKMTALGQGIDWKPVKLSSQLDKSWYNWFMKEYQTHIALHPV